MSARKSHHKGMVIGSLRHRIAEMLDAGLSRVQIRNKLISSGANPSTVREYLGSDEHGDPATLRRASIMHLVDLKRAGHSPKRTELDIPTDLDKPARFTRASDIASYFGSSSAMCAELGS